MTRTKQSVIDQIEVLATGHLNIRRTDIILEDGIEISKIYHRHALSPGDDLNSEDTKVQAVARSVWTDDVVHAYKRPDPPLFDSVQNPDCTWTSSPRW